MSIRKLGFGTFELSTVFVLQSTSKRLRATMQSNAQGVLVFLMVGIEIYLNFESVRFSHAPMSKAKTITTKNFRIEA